MCVPKWYFDLWQRIYSSSNNNCHGKFNQNIIINFWWELNFEQTCIDFPNLCHNMCSMVHATLITTKWMLD